MVPKRYEKGGYLSSSRQHRWLYLGKSTPFGGVIHGSNPCGAATQSRNLSSTSLLLFLRLNFRNLFPILQLSFERLDKRIPESVENSGEYIRLRTFERSRKRHLGCESVFRVIAHNFGQRAENCLPHKLRRIFRALLIKNNHVIENRFDVTLVVAVLGIRFHCHFECSFFESETAMRLGEVVQLDHR